MAAPFSFLGDCGVWDFGLAIAAAVFGEKVLLFLILSTKISIIFWRNAWGDKAVEGTFVRNTFVGSLVLLGGAILTALCIFVDFVDEPSAGRLYAQLAFGLLLCVVGIYLLTMNLGAYILVDRDGIRARYHWFGRLKCSINQVAYVQPRINTLTILLKNGKRHTIMGVTNAAPLADFIRKQIFSPETESTDSLREKLTQAQVVIKKTVWGVIGGCVAMFANIFLAAAATGSRELVDFSSRDWMVFGAMMGVELLIVVGLFWLAGRAGKARLPIEHLQYRLRGAVIVEQPLPPGRMAAVYTDASYTLRAVVCGVSNSKSVYCHVQEFTGDDQLETVDTFEISDGSLERLETTFSELLDITALWQ